MPQLQTFRERILPAFPPIFHRWFLNNFTEPTAWLEARLAYSRTLAVMSMIGFVVGLGDRHGENILIDSKTGVLKYIYSLTHFYPRRVVNVALTQLCLFFFRRGSAC